MPSFNFTHSSYKSIYSIISMLFKLQQKHVKQEKLDFICVNFCIFVCAEACPV